MAFCKNCGSQLEDGSAFCAICGRSQNSVEPKEQETPMYTQSQIPVQPQQPTYVAFRAPVNPYGQLVVPGKGLGVASMVLGIISLVMFCIWYLAIPCAIIAAALGGIGIAKAKAVGMSNGMATAGVVCSCIALGIAVIIVATGAAFLADLGLLAVAI